MKPIGVGVFAPEETIARGNLEIMAPAGGSEHAFIVDATCGSAAIVTP